AYGEIEEGLAEPSAMLDAPQSRLLRPLEHEIAFSGVDFAFRGDDRDEDTQEPGFAALAGVNLRIRRGSYVAIVGPSGSGKSTLLSLLLRFHDPSAGVVMIDGHDLRSVTQASLRAQIGIVLQENFIFNATLRENIRLGSADPTEEALAGAVKRAGL